VEQRTSTNSIATLPAAAVTSLTVQTYSSQPTALSTLTALTSLELRGPCGNAQQRISAQHLQPLTRLCQLSLRQIDLACSGQQLLSLQSLTALQALEVDTCQPLFLPAELLAQLTRLDLRNSVACANAPWAALQHLEDLALCSCSLLAVPQQLSALTALTLDLSDNRELAGGWQHLLPLTKLLLFSVYNCSLTAVPEQVSALTALARLDLSSNRLSGGWQHLLPLRQLQDLNLSECGLTAMPEELSSLTHLTRLDLSGNHALISGWHHLLPLTQLQDLPLSDCSLNAMPMSELNAVFFLYKRMYPSMGSRRTLSSDAWRLHIL
jgi:Leucine-rich repeat (LRR) protein